MTTTELWFAVWNNIHWLVVTAAVICGSGLFILGCCTVVALAEGDDDALRMFWRVIRKVLPWAIASVILSAVPTTQDFWKVRVDLIKLQLASPENVKAGVERINEISKALECKYLDSNCPEKK